MSAALTRYDGYNERQVAIIKDQIAKGASDEELSYFLEVCRLTGLNPLQKQIYAVMRWSDGKQRMTIQTGIDGYRLLAARSHELAGIDDAVYDRDDNEHPNRATVTVYRKPQLHGERVAYTATARWSEYVQTTKDGASRRPCGLKMPYLMLAKCAEALALRKAFPAELSGLYTADEMAQADNAAILSESAARNLSGRTSFTSLTPPQKRFAQKQRRSPRTIVIQHIIGDDLSIGEFVRGGAQLGLNSKQMSERLGIPQADFHKINRREALEQLAGVVPEKAEAPAEPEEIAFVEEDHSQDADVAQDAPAEEEKPFNALGDVAFRKLCNSAGLKSIGQVETFLDAKFSGGPTRASRP
jgi:phage recombination protein Bet